MITIAHLNLIGTIPTQMGSVPGGSCRSNKDPAEKLAVHAIEDKSNAIPGVILLWQVHGPNAVAISGYIGSRPRPDIAHDLGIGVEIEEQLRIRLGDVAEDEASR